MAIILLLLSYASVYVNPVKFSLLAFAGLAYPLFLVLNFLFIILWIFLRTKYALLSMLIILLGWNHLWRLVQFNSDSAFTEEDKHIKILSYNIQNFVNENTASTKYITDFENQAKIIKYVQQQNADLICLQEALYDRKDHKNFHETLAKELNCIHSYHRNYYNNRKAKMDAIAIFTKYPMIDKGFLEYNEKTIGIYTDLIILEDTVRLYNLHLASIHFRKEEYDFISDITKQQNQQEFKDNFLKVISKINSAFIKRGYQTDIITEHINDSPYPVIICGDLNDTPTSYAYRILSKGLKDAFTGSGKGFGITYAGENFPAFRIDYILHDDMFNAVNFTRNKISLSDHYPISSILIKE
ncbi:MAG: endonuclease/exonuclease/phosphatase family protein [Bacteroidales bacterium]|nr:endonuclease/exonuclease/phosphatase family protein [Bacteroidales bacterium]